MKNKMKKQIKCKRKNCYWYSKKEKNKCCLDPAGCGGDCIQSGFKEHYIKSENKYYKYREIFIDACGKCKYKKCKQAKGLPIIDKSHFTGYTK